MPNIGMASANQLHKTRRLWTVQNKALMFNISSAIAHGLRKRCEGKDALSRKRIKEEFLSSDNPMIQTYIKNERKNFDSMFYVPLEDQDIVN